jgi:hypothetical protein
MGGGVTETPPGAAMDEQQPWHRLFGLTWADFCEGSALGVEPEPDLSLKQQFLDLLLRRGPGPLPEPLPDGFDDLGEFNVVTFKSHQEPLDGWALCEAIGHYVNTRKQYSPSLKKLHPESAFRLYAVCVRFPHNLHQEVPLTRLRPGVHELPLVNKRIRIIVIQELPPEPQNALLLLFSSKVEHVQYAREHYQPRSTEMSTLFYNLFKTSSEDPEMNKALKEYYQETIKQMLKDMPPEERLKGLSPKQIVEAMSPKQLVEAMSPEEARAFLEALQQKAESNGPSAQPD